MIYLKGFTHLSFAHVWHYRDCSRVDPVKLPMAFFGVFSGAGLLPVTFHTVFLMFHETFQYLFLCMNNSTGTLQDGYSGVASVCFAKGCFVSSC